jgi:hypothetical protein
MVDVDINIDGKNTKRGARYMHGKSGSRKSNRKLAKVIR